MLSDSVMEKICDSVPLLLNMVHTKRAKYEENLLSPSDYGQIKVADEIIGDHRDLEIFDLHVSLQLKLFGNFMDVVSGDGVIDSKYYQSATGVMQLMSQYYPNEKFREYAF